MPTNIDRYEVVDGTFADSNALAFVFPSSATLAYFGVGVHDARFAFDGTEGQALSPAFAVPAGTTQVLQIADGNPSTSGTTLYIAGAAGGTWSLYGA